MDNIGERLKFVRKNQGMTQDELSEKIGVSRGVIQNIEYNRASSVQDIVINAICDALDISKEWLLYGTGEMKQSEKNKLLNEIAEMAAKLSPAEQDYILDMMRTFNRHREKIQLKEPAKGLDAKLQEIERNNLGR